MAKTQPKIDDIKGLKKATIVSDGLMSKEDKIKLDSAIQGVRVNSVEITPDTGVVDITIPTTVEELSDSSEYAHLSNGKILEGNLPDYIFGQVLFGGFIAINTSTNKLVCTLSAKFKSKYNITENTLLLEDMPAANYEGVYFMAINSWNTQPNDGQVGDWIISNGITWSKVDNSDAVSSVNGQTGVVNLGYEDLGDMPVATNTEVGGIKLGYDNILSRRPEALPLQVETGETANKDKAFVLLGGIKIKELLGAYNSLSYNGDDVFISGILTTNYSTSNNFNELVYIGSYKVNGTYKNAPNQNCGTSNISTTNMKGSLNVFRSGVNDWETIQQLFWVLNDKTEQYQRSYDGTTWTVWRRLIKCDDYADMDGKGGIISSANFKELFRAPDIIQLWNADDSQELGGGTYYLNTFLPIDVTIQNIIEVDGDNDNNIINLNSGRVYRITYDVICIKVKGEGDITIRIEDGNGELYSMTDFIFESEIRKRITFSVMFTNLDFITPSIEVGSELVIQIHPTCYQIRVEEIKFPLFTPHNN